jgi:hypothetical protein
MKTMNVMASMLVYLCLSLPATAQDPFILYGEYLSSSWIKTTSEVQAMPWSYISDLGLNYGHVIAYDQLGTGTIFNWLFGNNYQVKIEYHNPSRIMDSLLNSFYRYMRIGWRWRYHPEADHHMDTTILAGISVYDLQYNAKYDVDQPEPRLRCRYVNEARHSAGNIAAHLRSGHRNEQAQSSGTHYMKARLRIEEQLPFPDSALCTMSVMTSNGDTLATTKILASEIDTVGYVDTRDLPFTPQQNMEYRVYWHGIVSMYLDYVAIDNACADTLMSGMLDASIWSYLADYEAMHNNWPCFGRFKIADEVDNNASDTATYPLIGYVSGKINARLNSAITDAYTITLPTRSSRAASSLRQVWIA